jgi:hypothetical protein
MLRPESPPPAAVVQPPSDAPTDQVRAGQHRHGSAAPPADADRPAVAGGQPPPQAAPEEAPPQADAPERASRSTTAPQSTTVPKKVFEVIYYPLHSAVRRTRSLKITRPMRRSAPSIDLGDFVADVQPVIDLSVGGKKHVERTQPSLRSMVQTDGSLAARLCIVN